MPKLAYVGLSHFRELSKKDFLDNDIPTEELKGIGHLKWARVDTDRSWNPDKVPNALEVPQSVIDFLIELEPAEWKVVEEGEKVEVAQDAGQEGESAMNPALGEVQSSDGSSMTRGARRPTSSV